MKIVVYTETFFPNMGGVERNTVSLCRGLKGLGHSVCLATPVPSAHNDDYGFTIKRGLSLVGLISLLSRSDLLLINGGIALKAGLCAMIVGTRFIPIFQNTYVFLRKGSGARINLKQRLRRYLVQRASAVISVSNYGAAHLNVELKEKFSLPNPIDKDLELKIDCIRRRGSTKIIADIIFVGRVIEGKGIFVLADAIRHLKECEGIKLDCLIVGEGPDLVRLRKYVEQYDLPFAFLGRQDGETLLEAYFSARILIVPSTTHIEGNPLVIAEALSCGLPVIVSDQPAMVDSLGDAGVAFKSGDSRALAEAIRKMQEIDFFERKKLACMALAAEFSYGRYIQRLEKILSSI